MADAQVESVFGVTIKGRAQGTNTASFGTPANYGSISAMKTRLAAANGTYYTAARLNQMTFNDLVYALRETDDAGTI